MTSTKRGGEKKKKKKKKCKMTEGIKNIYWKGRKGKKNKEKKEGKKKYEANKQQTERWRRGKIHQCDKNS